jgi:hypothetical protein
LIGRFFNFFPKRSDWMAASQFASEVGFDTAFPILRSLLIRGVHGRRGADSWHPLMQPQLPLVDQNQYAGYATTTDILGREHLLIPYFREVQRLCGEYPSHVDRGTYYRTETLLCVDNKPINIPSISMTATDPEPIIQRMLSESDGELLLDVDQAETVEIHKKGDHIFYHLFNTNRYKSRLNIHFPCEPFQTKVREADARLTSIVKVLCRGLRIANWQEFINPR